MNNQVNHILELHTQGKTWTEIGSILGIDRRTAKNKFDKYMKLVFLQEEQEYMAENLAIKKQNHTGPRLLGTKPEVDRKRFQPLVATGDMLVTCDWHVPLYDSAMVNSVLRTAHKENIKKLVIGGDFFNGDSVSRYDDKQVAKEAGYLAERKHALEIFDVLLDEFDEIDLFEGNHDYRFVKLFGFQLNLDQVIKEVLLAGLSKEKLDKLRISVLDYMYLDQHKVYRFSHQRNFSKVPLTVGYGFAGKYNMSIITAHSHHCAMGVAKDGINVIIEGGGLYDKNITEYIQKTSDHHEWVQGYTMFKNRVPTLFSPQFGNI